MENDKWEMDTPDPTPRLERFGSYDQACRDFRWRIPGRFNVANEICRRHADAVTRVALSDVKEGGINTYSFGGLDFLSDKFATGLTSSGIGQGDPVAVVLPPSAALAVAHLGALKAGAVVVHISINASDELLQHAFADSVAKALVVDERIYGAFESLSIPDVASRFVVRDLRPSNANLEAKDFWSEVDRASAGFDAVDTDSNSAALIFYIESPDHIDGIVHSHRSVIGQLAAFEMFNNIAGESEAVFWTADDWTAPPTVLGMLYPAWWYGCSVVAGSSENRAHVVRYLEQCEVTNVFIPASLPMTLVESEPRAGEGSISKIRTVLVEARRQADSLLSRDPSITLNEVHSGPETGWLFGSCAQWFPTQAGSAGRPVPGRILAIVDETGRILPAGHVGNIAVHKTDPALFTEYRGDADKTAASFRSDWFLTGDVGYKNGDGDLYVRPK